ncbi:CBF/Mak21 family-domain-containing protein [Neohortaea acidophila]|uniref:CBF/Mak21 family-domain-containing protein n=1 Tax=Neohortaea acidophila TaxID=245834 RepID=A0A6A6PMF3_9PEZI|nr:CBF/Mak21 family-domain-containing protein [Neohortaea acidophila]KAF2480437.1 CBF/Mak21 family-domain-containing protein [Neohortaea acidophila]
MSLTVPNGGARKRKRTDAVVPARLLKSRDLKDRKVTQSRKEEILWWEQQLVHDFRQRDENIVKLQNCLSEVKKKPKTSTLAAVALCRVFCRLIASEQLIRRPTDDQDNAGWLKLQLREYTGTLLHWIGTPDEFLKSTALTLVMRIVKAETSQEWKRAEQAWRTDRSTFYSLVATLLATPNAQDAIQEFVEKYVEEFDDVRFYTMLAIKQFFSAGDNRTPGNLDNALDLLKQVEGVPESDEQLEDWYGVSPDVKGHQLLSLNAHLKIAQDCWLSIFRSALTASNRKTILNIMTERILPWFSNRMEILTDFLTDSFNESGSVALLALSGIFHLMTQRNLDYPDFYTKLYSLLDENILHTKHRSRFFRLLDQFMASSHLPAALVASFIKRLARLSLQAPPGAIVWVVPWVYNLLRKHPTCTFMLHRPYHPAHAIYSSQPKYTEEGMDDPFDPLQSDPMLTHAIESSLWELRSLQEHWHPNVATLAKILGEQFTKKEYQLEDFLDHGYATLIEAELGKGMKKKPEVEWEIPKRIVTDDAGGLNEIGVLLRDAIQV